MRTSISGTWTRIIIRGCSDEPMIPFRYGDYSAIRKNYMPADYRKDADGYDIVGSVYVEAEWDRKIPSPR